jgi:predicted nuclease of predicted toxin-antitoxin system
LSIFSLGWLTKKILVDEMDDGMDEKLNAIGYEAYSVKKLRNEGKKLHTDYSIITYAKENNMILVTRDTESGQACQENNLPCILLDNEEIFKIVVEKLKQFS